MSAWLFTRFFERTSIAFNQVKEILVFLILCTIFSTGLMAIIPASTTFFITSPNSFWDSWRWWFISDGIGSLLFTTFILSWASWLKSHLDKWNWIQVMEGILLLSGLTALNLGFLHSSFQSTQYALFLPYLTFPFLLWAAFRFGMPGVTSALLVLAAITLWFVVTDRFHFFYNSDAPFSDILGIQFYLALLAIPSLFLAAVVKEREQTRLSLCESEERFRLAMDASNDGLWDWDIVTNQVYCSPGYWRILGYQPNESLLKPQDWLAAVHPDDKEHAFSVKHACIDNCYNAFQVEFRMKTKKGDWRWIQGRGKAINRDANGKALRMVGTHSDITERKKMEEEILKVRNLESIGILAGGIAHDFNNLLTAILGNIDLAGLHASTSSELTEYLQQAQTAVQRAQGLTKQLLTFSKGGAPIRENASLPELVRETAQFSLRGSSASCIFHFPGNLWLANIDKDQISQVIQNLVINASQAMKTGGKVMISGENFTLTNHIPDFTIPLQPGNYIKLIVKDEGIGIAEKDLPKIFDPYYTTKSDGNGLGLATVYSIVKSHNGWITVTSQPGEGAVFTLFLPAVNKTSAAVQQPLPKTPMKGKGRILVMDDEEMIRKLVSRFLEQMGYEADTAVDGTEAISKYKQQMERGTPYDAVIMDLTISGGMGGKEAIQHLRAFDPQVQAIVSSGYSGDPIMANYLQYGFQDVINKPYKIDEMGQVLNRVCMKSSR